MLSSAFKHIERQPCRNEAALNMKINISRNYDPEGELKPGNKMKCESQLKKQHAREPVW